MKLLRLFVLTFGLWMASELAGQAEGSVPAERPQERAAVGSEVIQSGEEPAKTECCMPW
ncbi:MAG: hypothetical protein AAF358_07290 [Pseudomonadota bacterium]